MSKRSMFKRYQQVQLKCKSFKDIFDDETVELKKGQRGIILDVLSMPNLPIGYNVEFFDKTGDTVAVTTLEEKDLSPALIQDQNTKT